MIKKFRKMTTLALVLALILTVSASVFAVNSYHNGWFASDGTVVEYYATINTERTYGYILSESNQGEVDITADYTYRIDDTNVYVGYLGYTDIDYADVYAEAPDDAIMDNAHYYFVAYVPTDNGGESFESGEILLMP